MIGYALAFIAGWLACGVIHRVLYHLAIKVLTTAVGKEKLLEALAKTAKVRAHAPNLQARTGEGVKPAP